MTKFLCLLTGIFIITGCSLKMTKTEFINELEARNYCKGIACEKGVIIKENMNRMVLGCTEKALKPMPNEITYTQVKKILPEIESCIQTEGEFTPIISKDKMLFAVMDRDNTDKFSKFSSNISRLELNNHVAHCYKLALDKMPPVMTMNQFKTVELKVQKCMFDKFKASNEET